MWKAAGGGKKKNKSVVSRNDQSHEKKWKSSRETLHVEWKWDIGIDFLDTKKKKENPHAEM